jgi:hypothetical protein
MNILAYVHLRNIYGSTGAGRVARNIIGQLISLNKDDIRVLADAADHVRIIPQVGVLGVHTATASFTVTRHASKPFGFYLMLRAAELF